MFDDFEKYMYGSLGLSSGSMTKFVFNMTKKLFELKKTPNLSEIKSEFK